MRVLITWGSKLGGTEGIAAMIGETLRREGIDVVLAPAARARDLGGCDAVIVGGALYANRWHADARRFVNRNVASLRRVPVWTFSSGPLDDSADHKTIAPVPQVAVLMERIGALGHATFGGRLAADAKGFPAAAMAKTHSGDWRNPDRVAAWATEIARALPSARPAPAIDPPARSPMRVVAHGVLGWAACAVVMAALLGVASTGVAIALHAIAAPLVFGAIAVHYFGARGAREPLPVALTFGAIVAVLDAAVVGGLFVRSFAMFASFAGTWLPIALLVLVTWLVGAARSTMPWPKDVGGARGAARAGKAGAGGAAHGHGQGPVGGGASSRA